jgi:hypothetical protein
MNGDIDANSNNITNLAAPSNNNDAARKVDVDNAVTGIDWKEPCLVLKMVSDADQGAAPPVGPGTGDAYVVNNWGGGYTDGDIVEYNGTSWVVILDEGGAAEPADGTRVIVTDTSAAGSFAGEENGIATYDATGNTWSFTDPLNRWSLIIDGEAGYYENLGFTYDLDDTEWVQFTGTGQINAGDGLLKSGNTLDVRAGDGIEIASDYVAVDLYTTSEGGLEFVGSTPNGELRVKVGGANGIVLGSTGVELEIDDSPNTLDVDADGLKVVGLPSLFEINDVAVGSTVTAANLDTLTDTSNADSLHTHSVVPVDESKRIENTYTNDVIIADDKVVCWSTTNNEIRLADNSADATALAIGVARSGGAADATSEVVEHGLCEGVLTGATVGTAYYLGASGAMVVGASVPRPGRVIRIGVAKNATDMNVNIQDLGYRLAA